MIFFVINTINAYLDVKEQLGGMFRLVVLKKNVNCYYSLRFCYNQDFS